MSANVYFEGEWAGSADISWSHRIRGNLYVFLNTH